MEWIDAYRCRVQLGADSLDTLAQEIVALGADVEVDGPPELIEHLHAVGRRLLATGAGDRISARVAPGSRRAGRTDR